MISLLILSPKLFSVVCRLACTAEPTTLAPLTLPLIKGLKFQTTSTPPMQKIQF